VLSLETVDAFVLSIYRKVLNLLTVLNRINGKVSELCCRTLFLIMKVSEISFCTVLVLLTFL